MNRLLPQRTIRQLRLRRRSAKLVTTSVKLPIALARDLKAEARRQDRSQSWVIVDALSGYIEFRKAKEVAE